MRQILVPTDFSNDAYNALFYATQLYKYQQCTFHILHTYDRQSPFKEEYKRGKTTKTLKEFMAVRAAENLQATYHRIIGDTEKNTLHDFVKIPMKGPLEKALKNYLTLNPIGLVVMGTKGRTGATNIFFGGNTIQIIKSKIDCPLLCIPKQIDYRPISQLGYITSLKHVLEKYSLSIVKSLVAQHEAALHIVHIDEDESLNKSQEKNKTLLSAYFKNACLYFHTIPFNRSKAKTLAKFAKAHELDILAMCYYRHYFLTKLLREPVVLDLSFYAETPLLLLPTQE